jgi:adenylate cyclase
VAKGDLMDAVWPGVSVEENTLQVHISALRRTLGSAMILTVHGRGYKYAGPDPRSTGGSDEGQGPGPLATADMRNTSDTDLTSIAVLPFKSLTGDADTHILADGLAEDIITELARYRHLRVTGHRISAQFGAGQRDPAAISQELGVDFILDGSVRTAGSAIRVVVELIDADTGAHAWGDRFNCDKADIFAVQDDIVGAVIGRLAFNLTDAAGRKRQRDPTTSGSAYTQFLQAKVAWRESKARLAMQHAEKAVEIDPAYGRAHAYIAFFLGFSHFNQSSDLTTDEIDRRSHAAIERALALDPDDPFILQRAAMTFMLLGDPQKALRYADLAASVSASDSDMLVIHGMITAYCGDVAKGCAMMERAVSLDHRLAPSLYLGLIEVRHLMGDYEGSLAVVQRMPDPPFYIRLYEAASRARLGQTDAVQRILAETPPGFDLPRFARLQARTCALPKDAGHWLESFRLMGITV